MCIILDTYVEDPCAEVPLICVVLSQAYSVNSYQHLKLTVGKHCQSIFAHQFIAIFFKG